MIPTGLRSAPAITYRRYPLLSDDGQPCFPRLPRKSRIQKSNMAAARATVENDHRAFLSVRAIALLALVIIVAILAAA